MAGMILLAFACHKDNQKFDYQEINNVTVETDVTSYTLFAGDSLIVIPKLKESMPTGEEFTYAWTASIANSSNASQTQLSASKDLRVKLELVPATYNLNFKVTSKKTGITSMSRVTLTVQAAFYSGWYVANNRAGKASMSFIRADDKIYENPAEEVNKKTYTGKALSVFPSTSIGVIYFFTAQNAYRFNINDLLELTDRTGTLPLAPVPYTGAPVFSTSHSSLVTDQYIVADGALYAGLGPTFYAAEVLKPFSDRLTGDYNMFPGVFPAAQTTTMFYDNKYKRFMQLPYLDRDLTVLPQTAGNFNLANVGRTMIAYDSGVAGNNNEFYYVMEAAGIRSLISTVGIAPGISQAINNSPEINEAKHFATSSIFKQMYYAATNKIYKYDILANSSTLVYTFPAGYVVKDLELQRAPAASNSRILAVGTNKGDVGEVYLFDISDSGDFVNQTYTKKYEGFGEIICIKRR
ncbi:PKD-like family lipoprotein [Pedobacter africanus]|uniref:Uncharacterized protein n=1 Tax=Pedobacter africanus TaxID=151894 RepID=A0ACC6KQM0_9SPHI|nr:PKD-like family lipoprotein [Pedobacter africanus]MDR6781481.1 hypothetical protein [Pedobacter africanus]